MRTTLWVAGYRISYEDLVQWVNHHNIIPDVNEDLVVNQVRRWIKNHPEPRYLSDWYHIHYPDGNGGWNDYGLVLTRAVLTKR